MRALLVLCTCPDEASAHAIAGSLVEKRLAACVNILPRVRSVYRWEGRIEQADEIMLLAKTMPDRFDDLRDCVVGMHPYALPEVLGVEAAAALEPYLQWIEVETRPTRAPA